MIRLSETDRVTVLTLDADENRFNGPFIAEFDSALAAAAENARPLVIRGEGKFFSNGLDLEWLRSQEREISAAAMSDLCKLMAKIMIFPGATVAAVNGHAFGAGAILAAAADFRVMRADRGYFCFPEVDLHMVMTDPFDALLQAKYPNRALLEGLITGRRYGGPEAKQIGFVDEVSSAEDLTATAISLVADLIEKDAATVSGLKAKLYESAIAVLRAG